MCDNRSTPYTDVFKLSERFNLSKVIIRGMMDSESILITAPLGLTEREASAHLVEDGEALCGEFDRWDGQAREAAEPCSACQDAQRRGRETVTDGGLPAHRGVGAAAAAGRPAARLEVPGLAGPVELSRTEAVALGAVAALGAGGLALALL